MVLGITQHTQKRVSRPKNMLHVSHIINVRPDTVKEPNQATLYAPLNNGLAP